MDRQRIVRPNADWSTISTVIDLTSAPAYQPVADTWAVTPPPSKPQQAVDERRYGGSHTVGETHDNGTVAWITLVGGASADATLGNMRALLAQLESVTPGLYVEWRPDGATNSVYYEIRGPATWKPNYRWVQFAGVHSLTCEIQVPVAPLAVSEPMVIGPFTQDLPAVIELDETIPGDAPALMTVKIGIDETLEGSNFPVWGLIAWTKRPTAGLGLSLPAPFAILTANAFPGTDGHLYGSWRSDVGGPETFDQTVDTTEIPRDPFTDTLTVEVWGRFENSPSITDARAVLSAGTDYTTVLSMEFGAAGCPVPSSPDGHGYIMVRLGTIELADDMPTLKVTTTWTPTATEYIGLDYLIVVPIRQRAAGATAKPLDENYPRLFPVGWPGSPTFGEKAILPDLSGRIEAGVLAAAAIPEFQDSGLGGCPMEIPPGDVDLLVKLSAMVPDAVDWDSVSDVSADPDIAITAIVQPRWFLARGA